MSTVEEFFVLMDDEQLGESSVSGEEYWVAVVIWKRRLVYSSSHAEDPILVEEWIQGEDRTLRIQFGGGLLQGMEFGGEFLRLHNFHPRDEGFVEFCWS